MPRPTTKDELLAASESRYRALLALVDGLPPEALDREFGFEDRDRRVRDVLGHLHVWHLMMLGWYEEGMAGRHPAIPAPGHTWSTLPALNAEIWQRCQASDLPTTRAALEASHGRLQELIRSHTDAELFTKKRYPWTGSTSLGAYLVSSTSSHYDWAAKKIRRYRQTLG
ncbi:ClbS/DfsB family four-helix bundle protein [Cellulomonas sp. KRMCY2]|uniref:ClbS/DfsB family four-helix bundle protein n=1 Tax=Cellulomonas sp. KRMCY2 TaxID=1304865 RepID=UPI00045EA11C|nr:ClbS/DfsB family four-helix bundle protein [Cellulomonas sp. KRMCY2]